MTAPRHIRDVMSAEPQLRRFCERLGDPEFPTAAEVAEAKHVLAQTRAERQNELPPQGAA